MSVPAQGQSDPSIKLKLRPERFCPFASGYTTQVNHKVGERVNQ